MDLRERPQLKVQFIRPGGSPPITWWIFEGGNHDLTGPGCELSLGWGPSSPTLFFDGDQLRVTDSDGPQPTTHPDGDSSMLDLRGGQPVHLSTTDGVQHILVTHLA